MIAPAHQLLTRINTPEFIIGMKLQTYTGAGDFEWRSGVQVF